ncbi:hypothetical protein DMUE_0960 [Dictyocoela muelleri]|nr:hypothetical protein DMUE_0960 [Dictyocoela muelleri]
MHNISCHPGTTVLYQNIRKYFYVKNIFKEIIKVTKSCVNCCENKNYVHYKKEFNQIESKKIFAKISTDIYTYGPFDIRKFKHEISSSKAFFITFTVVFSKYTKIYLLKSITGKNIVNKLRLLFEKFKKPDTLISDNRKSY